MPACDSTIMSQIAHRENDTPRHQACYRIHRQRFVCGNSGVSHSAHLCMFWTTPLHLSRMHF